MAVFLNNEASKEEIHLAGVSLTAGQHECSEALDQERKKIVRKKCAAKSTKKIVDMARLPPTTDAIHIHSKGAYVQIQTWIGNALNPENYGRKMRDGMLEPIFMLKKPTPDNLLDIKKCFCKEMRSKGKKLFVLREFSEVHSSLRLSKLRKQIQ